MEAAKKTFNFFASYGFACVVLTLLLILVFFGTLEQTEDGLYVVQKKYFESMYVVHDLFDTIPILLPGVYLLLVLLFINLVCGAIIRAPKQWKRPGMLIAHGGIIFMIFSGFVTYHYSTSGHMTLYEDEQSSEFQSYYDWEIVIDEIGDENVKRFVIPHNYFAYLSPEEVRTFEHPDLPFDVQVDDFILNSRPRLVTDPSQGAGGALLVDVQRAKQAEQNIAGAYATMIDENGETVDKAVLWGAAATPYVTEIDGQRYALDLRHKRWEVPFTIHLDKFIRELHPRTGIAANFESEVTKIEDGVERKIHIKMNEPLRHEGYTFFQASWGPQGAGPNEPLFSTFAVVNNPADQWPLYSCIVITIGLLIHFGQKLFLYMRAENRRRQRNA